MKKLEQTARDAINGKIKLTDVKRRALRTKLIAADKTTLAWMLDSVA